MLDSELCGKRVWFLLQRRDQLEFDIDIAMEVDQAIWSHLEGPVRRRLLTVRSGVFMGLERWEVGREFL